MSAANNASALSALAGVEAARQRAQVAGCLYAAAPGPYGEVPWLRGLAEQGLLRAAHGRLYWEPGIAQERAAALVRGLSGLASCPDEWVGVREAREALAHARELVAALGWH